MSIENLTGRVLADSAAQIAYLDADSLAPDEIADNYLQAKLAGRKSECLGLELAARQLAMRYFHKPGVNEMLAKVERYKAMRKPGTRAPKMFQDIAGEIERRYKTGMYTILSGSRIQFHIDSLTVTCDNMPGAVALVVAKYRRGLPRRDWRAR